MSFFLAKIMPDLLKPEDFQSLTAPLAISVKIGETTTVLELLVRAVKALPAHRFRDAPFSLLLAGPRAPLLPQGSYPVRHPALGILHLFLVPVGQDAQSTEYEITFN
jgi:hypothetical protein